MMMAEANARHKLLEEQKAFAKVSAQMWAHQKTSLSAHAPATQAKQHALAQKSGKDVVRMLTTLGLA